MAISSVNVTGTAPRPRSARAEWTAGALTRSTPGRLMFSDDGELASLVPRFWRRIAAPELGSPMNGMLMAKMLRAKTIQILSAILFLVAGAGSHDLAMAQGPMPDGVMAMMQVHHDSEPSGCHVAAHCGVADQPCCVVGQCLFAVPCSAVFSFPMPVTLVLTEMPPRTVAIAILAMPFRPPLWLAFGADRLA